MTKIKSNGAGNVISVLLVSLIASFGVIDSAFAYLDPGTGSMLIQLVLGGLAGIAVAGRLFWVQITGFFQGLFSRSKNEPVEEDEQLDSKE